MHVQTVVTGEMCCCGQLLHYESDADRDFMLKCVADLGPNIQRWVSEGLFEVPRHFVALHGRPADSEVAILARRYGWRQLA